MYEKGNNNNHFCHRRESSMSGADTCATALLADRLSMLEDRVKKLEEKRMQVEVETPVERVRRDLQSRHVYSARFLTVQPNYYDLTLEERAEVLKGKVPQLCKSIIFENTACEHNDCSDPTNSKYYCVIVQYIAKIDTILLRNLIHSLRPVDQRLSKKSFHFQLASDDVSLQLTGFGHNGIAPFGFTSQTNIPIVVCNRCLEVQPPLLYLGGGEVDVKLLIPLSDLLRSTNAITGLITENR